MDLSFLRSLSLVVEGGSFADAARQQGVTAPAVAQRVRTLEDQLGLALVHRAGRVVRPTAACLRAMPHVRRLLQAEDALRLALLGQGSGGRFRLGAITTALSDHISDVTMAFARDMPGVELRIVPGPSAALFAMLEKEELDAALLVRPSHDLPKSVDFGLIAAQPIVEICPLHAHPAPAEALPYIVYDRQSWGGAQCWAVIEAEGAQPKILCELDSLETIAQMVAKGLGRAVVPQWEGLAQLHPEIALRPLSGPRQMREVGLAWPTALGDHPAIGLIRAALCRA